MSNENMTTALVEDETLIYQRNGESITRFKWELPPGMPGCRLPQASMCIVRSEPLPFAESKLAISVENGIGVPTVSVMAHSTAFTWAWSKK